MKISRKKSILILTFILFWGFVIGSNENPVPDSLSSPFELNVNYNSSRLDSLKTLYSSINAESQNNKEYVTQALASIYLSEIYRYKRKYDSALYFLNESKKIIKSKKIDHWLTLYNYHVSFASSLYFKGDTKRITRHIDSALIASKEVKLDSLKQGRIYSLKYTVYNNKYQYDSALHYVVKSLSHYPKKHKSRILYSHLNRMAALYRNTGQIDKAEEALFKALNESDSIIPGQKSVAYYNLGEHFKNIGDYEKGLYYFNLMLTYDSIRNLKNRKNQINAYINISEIYKLKGEALKGINWTKKIFSNFKDLKPIERINIYNFLGNLYKVLGQYDESMNYFSKALKITEEIDITESIFKISFTYIYFGDIIANYFNNPKGIAYIEKGIEFLKKYYGNKSALLKYPNLYLSNAYLYLYKDYYKALFYLYQAQKYNSYSANDFDLYQKIPPNNKISYLGSLYDLNKQILLLTEWINNGYNNEKGDTLNNALLWSIESYIETEDILRGHIKNQNSKIIRSNIGKKSLRNSSKSLQLLYKKTNDLKYIDYLYSISSRYKSISLEESISDTRAQFANIPDSIIQNGININHKVGELSNLIENERRKERINKNKVNRLQNSLDDVINNKHQYELMLETSYPQYYKLKHDKKTFTIDDIQRNLSKDRVLIEYSILNDSTLNMFAITKNEFKYFSVVDTAIIENTDKLINYVSLSNFINLSSQRLSDFKSTSYYLYTKLLQPFSQLIEGKKLIINPDDKLWYLPFEILLTDSATNIKNFRNLPYLIKDHPISYAYSTKLYFDKDENRSPNPGNVLTIVPSYDASINYIDELLEKNTKRDQLRPLPNSIKEAEFVQQTLGGKLLKAEDASEKNFKNLADKYKILHLAMHAVIDNKKPQYSKLIFTHGVDTTEDNYLNTYEIYNNRLNADLAVLSSCNSGSGKMQKGEGIISIARAFLYAGCPSLVTTLWSVDDASSAKLMQYFYENLKEGMSKSEALQQAKLKFIETASPLQQHPYFWASYTQIGNDDSIDFKRKTSAYIWITIVVIFLISSYFLLRKQKAKQA